MPIKFLLLGGGFWVFLEGGGWKCQFYFYGRGDFSDCHTNRSVKLPSFRHFQDQFLTTNKEKWGKKNGPVFRDVCSF